jgi:hypothetical protein
MQSHFSTLYQEVLAVAGGGRTFVRSNKENGQSIVNLCFPAGKNT